MGKYYKNSDELYKALGTMLERVSADADVGEKLRAAKVAVRFNYSDPAASITVNAKAEPKAAGKYFEYHVGSSNESVDVELMSSADFGHRFWLGKENAALAVAMGRMKAKGDLDKALALLPAIKPVFKMFPKILHEIGMGNLAR